MSEVPPTSDSAGAPAPGPVPGPESALPAPAPRPWWWKVLGLRRRPGRFLRVVPTLWGWFVLLVVVMGVGGAAFMEYSMQPDFCRSCHLMEPYYQAWHQSTHKDVNCILCHFEPGLENTLYGKFQASSQAAKFITKTYGSKPHAEVHDSSCMRSGCHERRLIEGKVDWTLTTAAGAKVTIRFDHAPHLKNQRRGLNLRCVSCHSQLVQGQHIVVTLDTCFTCHFKGLKHGRENEVIGGCKGCHDAPKDEIRLATGVYKHSEFVNRGVTCENCHADSIRGNGEVPRERCWDCHNQPRQVQRYDETTFVHETHITAHKVECISCHIQIAHSLNAAAPPGAGLAAARGLLGNAGSCAQCHEQSHNGPAELYRGTGGVGVPDMPSPMFRAHVNCIACHQFKENAAAVAQVTGQTFQAGQERCDYCHGEKYNNLLAVWKTAIDEQLARAQAALNLNTRRLDAAMGLSEAQRLDLQRHLDDAGHNINLVRLGHGVHNVTYATALLSVSLERCATVARQLAPVPAPTTSLPGTGAPAEAGVQAAPQKGPTS